MSSLLENEYNAYIVAPFALTNQTRSVMEKQNAQKSGSYSVPTAQTARAMAKAVTYSSANSQTRSSNIASKSGVVARTAPKG